MKIVQIYFPKFNKITIITVVGTNYQYPSIFSVFFQFSSGSGSKRETECRSMWIRIHSPAAIHTNYKDCCYLQHPLSADDGHESPNRGLCLYSGLHLPLPGPTQTVQENWLFYQKTSCTMYIQEGESKKFHRRFLSLQKKTLKKEESSNELSCICIKEIFFLLLS